jgi:lysosomal alpha-mannosidase
MKSMEVKAGLNHVFIPMGGDFQFIEGERNFEMMDQLIARFRTKIDEYGLNLMYSTPQCYLEALESLNQSWSQRSGDMFPFVSRKF